MYDFHPYVLYKSGVLWDGQHLNDVKFLLFALGILHLVSVICTIYIYMYLRESRVFLECLENIEESLAFLDSSRAIEYLAWFTNLDIYLNISSIRISGDNS